MERTLRRTPSIVVVSLAGSALSVLGAAAPALAQPFGFDPVFELSSLLPENGGDGSLGFVLNGDGAGGRSGTSVSSAGDINGDGIDDVVIGAPRALHLDFGLSYVVFGRPTNFPASIDLSSLDGSTGFGFYGHGEDAGESVACAGDVNGDGFDDILIGDPTDNGKCYIIFGRASNFPALVGPSILNGSTGFRLSDFLTLGKSVSAAGDVNGDGIDDFIAGAPGRYGSDPGLSFIVLGRTTGFPAEIEVGDVVYGSAGFVVAGIQGGDRAGQSVCSAGDVNGDGIDDVIIGAPFADCCGFQSVGESYVVFGRTSGFPNIYHLQDLDGGTGFRIDGIGGGDQSGFSVSAAGDVNSDGIDDVIVGAWGADFQGESDVGVSYIVYGRGSGFPASVELTDLSAESGFQIVGEETGDESGIFVSEAGDVNGDGIDDILIGASGAGATGAGVTYVVFGSDESFPETLLLEDLDGANGLRIEGIATGDLSGRAVSQAGDVNGDGVDDLIIGAPTADPGGRDEAGESYVVFGRRSCRADFNNDHTLDAFDYDDFVNDFFNYVNNGTGFPDYNQDTYVDAFDYDDFVSDFFTGCG